MNEAEFQQAVIALCRGRGYLVHACGTATSCDGKGLPDLIIASTKGVIFAELKSHSMSKVRPEQTTWGHTLRASGQHYRRWTVADWESRRVHADLDRLGVPIAQAEPEALAAPEVTMDLLSP